MTTKEKRLASEILEDVAEDYSNHGCNDWEFPADWSDEERTQFVKEYHDMNGDPEEFDPKFLWLPDYGVMQLLAFKLRALKLTKDQKT